MTPEQRAKMKLCFELAQAITRSYRVGLPEGFDPKMSMAVVAVVGGVAALGSAAVQYSSAKKAGKDAKNAAGQAAGQFQATGRKADSMLAKYERMLSDPRKVLAMTMNANNENWTDATNQATRLNNWNQAELSRTINKSLPGYQGMIGTALRNTRSWLRGKLPTDVAAAVEDRAAERATAFGLPADSTARKSLTARDLGRTSLDLMNQGENSLQRWISTARSFLTAAPASPMDFLFTPTQYQNSVLAGANVAAQRAGIITGAGNQATNAYLQGEQAGIAADQASSQAIAQGIESIGGIGMAYGASKAKPAGGMGGGGMGGGASGSSMSGFLASLGIGSTGVGMASPTTYQAYLNS